MTYSPDASDTALAPAWDSAPPFGRRETLLRALRRLHALHPGPATIVETGTLRNDSPSGQSGDGWSTVAWGWYCAQTGGRVWTVDVDAGAIEVCQRVTAEHADHIEYVVADSVSYLREWGAAGRGAIDLLYLDSLDYIDGQASEAHALAEAQAALPWLARQCLVMFDDTSIVEPPGEDGLPPVSGKGARAVPFLLANGFRLDAADDAALQGGQVLLVRTGAGDAETGASLRQTGEEA